MVTDEIGIVRTVAGLCDFKGVLQSKRFTVASIKQLKKNYNKNNFLSLQKDCFLFKMHFSVQIA